MVLQVTSRTVPAAPVFCHGRWECAAVTVDVDTGQLISVCHTLVTPGRTWCDRHQTNGAPPP